MMERYKDNGICDFLKERYKNDEKVVRSDFLIRIRVY